MGRYASKITHRFSTNPDRPTFVQTLEEARLIYVNALLENMTPREQEEFIRIGKDEGLIT